MNSATGIAIQAPFIPRSCGRNSSEITVNTSVLQNDIMAEILPLDSAVKKPDEVILSPLNRKPIANILNAGAASSNVSLSFVNIVIIGVVKISAIIVRTTEETATKIKDTL